MFIGDNLASSVESVTLHPISLRTCSMYDAVAGWLSVMIIILVAELQEQDFKGRDAAPAFPGARHVAHKVVKLDPYLLP